MHVFFSPSQASLIIQMEKYSSDIVPLLNTNVTFHRVVENVHPLPTNNKYPLNLNSFKNSRKQFKIYRTILKPW